MNIFHKVGRGLKKIGHSISHDKTYKQITHSGGDFIENTFESAGDLEKGVGSDGKGLGEGIGNIVENTALFSSFIFVGIGLVAYKMYLDGQK